MVTVPAPCTTVPLTKFCIVPPCIEFIVPALRFCIVPRVARFVSEPVVTVPAVWTIEPPSSRPTVPTVSKSPTVPLVMTIEPPSILVIVPPARLVIAPKVPVKGTDAPSPPVSSLIR